MTGEIGGGHFYSRVVMDGLTPKFFDSGFCCRFVLSVLHPDGPACPGCGVVITDKRADAWWSGRTIQCLECKRKFTGRTGTILHKVSLSFQELVLLMILFETGVKVQEISRLTGWNKRSIYEWQGRFLSDHTAKALPSL